MSVRGARESSSSVHPIPVFEATAAAAGPAMADDTGFDVDDMLENALETKSSEVSGETNQNDFQFFQDDSNV